MFSVFQQHDQLFICRGTGGHVLDYLNQMKSAKNSE